MTQKNPKNQNYHLNQNFQTNLMNQNFRWNLNFQKKIGSLKERGETWEGNEEEIVGETVWETVGEIEQTLERLRKEELLGAYLFEKIEKMMELMQVSSPHRARRVRKRDCAPGDQPALAEHMSEAICA